MQKLLTFVCTSCFALLATLAANNAYADTHLDRIVATVNDQVITQSEFDQELEGLAAQQKRDPNAKPLADEQLRKMAFQELVAKSLQLQAAKLLNIKPSDDEIKQALTNVATQHHIALSDLSSAVAKSGGNYDTFKQNIIDQITIEKLQQQQLAGTIHINPKEVDALAVKLAKTPEQPSTTTTILYHFESLLIPLSAKPTSAELVTAKQKFDAIGQALNQGKNFHQIASEILQDSSQPIDLGLHPASELPPPLNTTAAKMHNGQVMPPLRAPDGIHIIKLVEAKTSTVTNSAATPTSNSITQTHVRHILLKKSTYTPDNMLERRLIEIRDAITHGTDFATEAKDNSQDPGSATKGGDLGWVEGATLDPKFAAAMDKLKVGEISQPVQSQFGYHLIQVLGRRQVQDQQAALKQRAQQILFQQKLAKAQKQMISQLKAQAHIQFQDKDFAKLADSN